MAGAMSNKQYMKKKPQNKAYIPSTIQQYDCSTETIDRESMGPMYEQIKSEVVCSVLNWLSLYLAAEQEDKRSNDEIIETNHCCECTLKKKHDSLTRSSFESSTRGSYNCEIFSPRVDSSTNTDTMNFGSPSSFVNSELMPKDFNMILTEYRAGQVWPEWCQYIDGKSDQFYPKSAANSPVYFDKVNSRLCVYRRGLVEYPFMNPISPKYDCKQSMRNYNTLPELKEALLSVRISDIRPSSADNSFYDQQKNNEGSDDHLEDEDLLMSENQ